jgi:hypothetical protein
LASIGDITYSFPDGSTLIVPVRSEKGLIGLLEGFWMSRMTKDDYVEFFVKHKIVWYHGGKHDLKIGEDGTVQGFE